MYTFMLCIAFQEPDDESLKPFIVPEVDHVNWERKLVQFHSLELLMKFSEPYFEDMFSFIIFT